jgi:antitoxin HicB
MQSYIFGFTLERQADDVFFRFAKFPEIRSAIPTAQFEIMSDKDILSYATDAVVTALQADINARVKMPASDKLNTVADGFVVLPVQQSMKVELAKVFMEHVRSVAQFARTIGKTETAARRLLNLSHRSHVDEIEAAIGAFGKRLVSSWEVAAPLDAVRTGQAELPHL